MFFRRFLVCLCLYLICLICEQLRCDLRVQNLRELFLHISTNKHLSENFSSDYDLIKTLQKSLERLGGGIETDRQKWSI